MLSKALSPPTAVQTSSVNAKRNGGILSVLASLSRAQVALLGLAALLLCLPASGADVVHVGKHRFSTTLLASEDFSSGLARWKTEGRGRVWAEGGRLQVDAIGSVSTAWFRQNFKGDLLLTYQAGIVEPADANNINLIFLASGPNGSDVLDTQFSGAYDEYHRIPNYIFTFTGTHTRLRRDPGFKLLSENMHKIARAGVAYDFAVAIAGGRIRCFINGNLIHDENDPQPHLEGKLAFRTFHTRLWWDNLRVHRIHREIDKE